MKISVIIPLFNKEQHISKSILSIVNQTYKNIEIIVIDDQSNDNGPLIVRDLAIIYSQIIFFKNIINQGVSFTRNYGLAKATGDYIIFLDADDYLINNQLIENLVKSIIKFKTDYIFLQRNYYGKKLKPRSLLKYSGCSKKIHNFYFINDKLRFIIKNSFPLGGSASAIIKREIIKNTKFDLTMSHFEDWLFFNNVLLNSTIPTFYKVPSIYINFDENSLSKSQKTNNTNPFLLSKYYYFLFNNSFFEAAKTFLWINLASNFKKTNSLNKSIVSKKYFLSLFFSYFLMNKYSIYCFIKFFLSFK
jgi:glycosyltransferase involved in cell wall biosynthesis